MSDVTSFDDDLYWSKLVEPYIIKLLTKYSPTPFYKSELSQDKKGSDISNGKKHVDIKANRPKYDDTNIIIEHKGGWLDKDCSITDYVCWVSNNSIILLNYKTLRAKYQKNIKRIKAKYPTFWRTSERNGSKWSMEMSLVPMEEMEKHIIKKWSFNWDKVEGYKKEAK